MCDREIRMTRKDIDNIFYQLDTKGKVIVSLLMDISDDLKIIREQNEKLLSKK